MSIQATLGHSGLVAAGVSLGDVATLFTIGRRLGNWLTAEQGDADMFSLLEEDEFDLLQRRGIIDINRFQARWNRTIRLLSNGTPMKETGHSVERLLSSSSHWTVMMTCIIATLDEFASASTGRTICKALLHRLFSSNDGLAMTEDVINASLQTRINGWRSAAAVRDMHLVCRQIRNELQSKDRVLQGYMPANDSSEVVEFLHWLMMKKDSDTFRTSSTDLAAIAYCLCYLSFEILSVEGFEPLNERNAVCRLIYSAAPLFGGNNPTRTTMTARELSTMVSLTQPNETFSTFPITSGVANACRSAWELGEEAGAFVELGPPESLESDFTHRDLNMVFHNTGTPVANQRRRDTCVWRIASLLAVFSSDEVNQALGEVLQRVELEKISQIADIIRSKETATDKSLISESIVDTFTVIQAFFMGYYYKIFSSVVDVSTLEVKTVSGYWGYRSPALLRRFYESFQDFNGIYSGLSSDNAFPMPRTKILFLLATLYANMDNLSHNGGFAGPLRDQECCVGVVGKRLVVMNSLLNDCQTPKDVCRFVVLDCDAGAIPRTAEGLMLTGIPQRLKTWEDETPATEEQMVLSGSDVDCTRHLEADWDGIPERLLLCIRYKGRRLGSLNPAHADIVFCMAYMTPCATPSPIAPFGPAHRCSLDDLIISGRLVTAGRGAPDTPVVVHTKGNPCLRSAMAAWYSDSCDVVLVTCCLQHAFERWTAKRPASFSSDSKFVALIG